MAYTAAGTSTPKKAGQSAFSGSTSSPKARIAPTLSAATTTQITVKSSQSFCQSFKRTTPEVIYFHRLK